MSIRGINFQNQKLGPRDDGVLYRALMDDGILTGCAMDTVGTTLAISAGTICSCGRLMAITDETFNLNQSTSGYARVLLRIDLTGSATTTTWEQAEWIVQYASTEGGFPSLTRDDVNASGTVYETVVAVCALSAAGISAITSRLGAVHIPDRALGGPYMPLSGGAFEGGVLLNGIALTEGVDYGTVLPTDHLLPGRLFFLKV